ncbi:hypothetical protein Pelo_17393 [Pelomyxa schiedti]|nr:hypothetical protein Pelo_17393 [Pelomyxa schiedti]
MEEYDLRQFNEADIPQVVALLKEVPTIEILAHIKFNLHHHTALWEPTNQDRLGGTTKHMTDSDQVRDIGCDHSSDDRKCGYLALVIVTAAHRRKGLCEVLIRKAHEILISQGTALIGLDASAMGFPTRGSDTLIHIGDIDVSYIAANFVTAISHFTGSELDEANTRVLLAGPHERTAIACSDKIAFGADRSTVFHKIT